MTKAKREKIVRDFQKRINKAEASLYEQEEEMGSLIDDIQDLFHSDEGVTKAFAKKLDKIYDAAETLQSDIERARCGI